MARCGMLNASISRRLPSFTTYPHPSRGFWNNYYAKTTARICSFFQYIFFAQQVLVHFLNFLYYYPLKNSIWQNLRTKEVTNEVNEWRKMYVLWCHTHSFLWDYLVTSMLWTLSFYFDLFINLKFSPYLCRFCTGCKSTEPLSQRVSNGL